MISILAGFFLIALLYSAAGFGGGSSYLAILVLVGWQTQTLAMLALACNLVVTGQGLWFFGVSGNLKWKNALPFLTASIPMALWGGLFKVNLEIWSLILGSSLLLSGAALLIPQVKEGKAFDQVDRKSLWLLGLGLGGTLGFLAGLVGIGGGIFLSPLLHLFRVGKGREIAALATVFILWNSGSGLLGQILKSGWPREDLLGLALIAAVLLGGNIGSRLVTRYFSNRTLRVWTAVLVVAAGIRILWKIHWA